MYNFVRKTMMIISIIFIGGIIYYVSDAILKEIKIDNVVEYSFPIIIALCIAVIILVESYRMKTIFCNLKLPYHYKIMFMLTSIFVVSYYLVGIWLFIYESFYIFETEISSIAAITPAFFIYITALEVVKRKAKCKI